MKNGDTMSECPICYEDTAKLSITCCNGHTCCQKHYLQRAKSIIEEGPSAHAAFLRDNNLHSCFLCRTDLNDNDFSEVYFKNLHLLTAKTCLLWHSGITLSNEDIVKTAEELGKRMMKYRTS